MMGELIRAFYPRNQRPPRRDNSVPQLTFWLDAADYTSSLRYCTDLHGVVVMKLNTLIQVLSGVAAAAVVTLAGADTLELRDGKTVNGVLIGATGDTLHVRAEGQVQLINIDDVDSIRFDKRPLIQSESGSVDPAKKRAIIVAAGTLMMVSLPQEFIQGNTIKSGRFTASLSKDFKSGDVIVAAAGSKVYGQVMSTQLGGLAMVLTDLTVAGDRLPIKTQSRPLPLGGESSASVEFRVERPFTLRLASN